MSNHRPPASQVARIATHLTQVIVAPDGGPDSLNVFYNARLILPGQIDSVSLNIIAPGESDPAGQLTAQLSWRESGQNKMAALFPGTVDIVAGGRRLVVTALREGSFDGLWVSVGLTEDGTSTELTALRSLRVLLTPGLTDTKLVWEDGVEETVL